MMMSIQFQIWKRLVTKKLPPSSMYLLSSLPFYAKRHLKFPNFCTQIATPSTTLDRGVIAEFLINKCGLTDEDIKKVFPRHKRVLGAKTIQNFEEALELLNGCGLKTPGQIRRVVLNNPTFFFRSSEMNIQSKLTLLRTFMKEKDIFKLLYSNSRIFRSTEGRIKAAISLLQRLGVEGESLSELLRHQPCLFTTSDRKVMEAFKQAEDLGLNKGIKMLSRTMRAILGVTKENFERRLHCLRSLGIEEIPRRLPEILGLSEEKVKLRMDFLVKSVGFPLHYVVKYPNLFTFSLEKRIIPRFRVMEALKSMKGLKPEITSPKFLMITETIFLEKYVNENANSLILLDIYRRGKVSHQQGDAR